MNRPPAWNLITTHSDVILKPGQQLDLLFKFLTHRDVSLSSAATQSKKSIKRRSLQIVIVMTNQQIYQQLSVDVVPSMALVDHTFRFYEPEESHYAVSVPPFVQMNQPGLSLVMSDPECSADLLGNASFITVQGKSGEAMSVQQSVMYVYGD